MTDNDAADFFELWASAQEYYGKRPSPGAVNLAFEVLKRFALADVSRALSLHLGDPDRGSFAPKPADVVRAIEGGGEQQAVGAWAKAWQAVQSIGAYQTVVFDDWKIHAAISRMGGWKALCHAEVGEEGEKITFLQRDFERHYKAVREGDRYPRKLIGITEAHNEEHGFLEHVPAPLLIGNESKAQKVLAGPEQTEVQKLIAERVA